MAVQKISNPNLTIIVDKLTDSLYLSLKAYLGKEKGYLLIYFEIATQKTWS
jgi:hypothetical protein